MFTLALDSKKQVVDLGFLAVTGEMQLVDCKWDWILSLLFKGTPFILASAFRTRIHHP